MDKKIQTEIDKVFVFMDGYTPTCEQYKSALDSLERLYSLRKKQEVNIDWTNVILGILPLVAVGVIINHEQFNIISSKALGFVKFRI